MTSPQTLTGLRDKWLGRKKIPGPPDPFGIGWERCAADLKPLITALRAEVAKLPHESYCSREYKPKFAYASMCHRCAIERIVGAEK